MSDLADAIYKENAGRQMINMMIIFLLGANLLIARQKPEFTNWLIKSHFTSFLNIKIEEPKVAKQIAKKLTPQSVYSEKMKTETE